MTDEMIARARRAVACKGWRWMRGMSNDRGQTIDCVFEDIGTVYCGEIYADMNALPDLTDPATLGCLLALVREAWGDPQAFVGWFDPHWKVIRCRTESLIGCLAGRGAIEAEALVAALEAAP